MTELVVKRGRSRRTHSEQFKQEVVDHCTRPGMSLANVARQHGLHPSLLARWVKERTGPARMTVSSQSPLLPRFVPLRVESAKCAELPTSARLSSKIEINMERGEDVAEKLDYQPGTFSVERHIRGKWVCDTCETLIQAPVPAHVIDKGMATTNLLAQVLVNKFADHLPLYRQEQMFDRTGYKLSASTMGSWMGQCGAALQPLVDTLRNEILKQGVLHADETPITMLCAKQALKTGSASKKAYLWAYATTQHANIKAVVFDFAEGRGGQHAKAFLDGWSGTLICDDYQGYKALIKDNQITEAACMAHARRKFFELFAANKSHIAQAALEQFNAIYAVEAQLQDIAPDERRHRRQAEIKPLMDKLRQWLLDHRIKVPDGSGTSRAIDYSLKRWDALTTFLDDPHTPIDNNWVENQIRPIAVGRKNWLFAGSLRSGQRNAAIMSLVQSAKLNGLNPLEYLKDVMDRLPTQPHSRINELLPHNWKPASALIES